jgi:hypothetical protein
MLEAGRTEGGGREQGDVVGFKSQSTAPRPLASWSHDTTPELMESCLHATTPWLLAPCALTGFPPRHGGADVSSYDASSCGAVLALGPFLGSFPRGLYIKI